MSHNPKPAPQDAAPTLYKTVRRSEWDDMQRVLAALKSQARGALLDDARFALAVDAAMVEMQNISPPLRRSECARLIRAALSAALDHS